MSFLDDTTDLIMLMVATIVGSKNYFCELSGIANTKVKNLRTLSSTCRSLVTFVIDL